jgi:hypothetical protein
VGFLTRRNFILTAIAAFILPRWAYAAPVEPELFVYDPEECVLDYAIETLAKLKQEWMASQSQLEAHG